MILVDTSAWVEFLRATGSPAHRRVRELLATDVELLTTDVIVMEVLAGARDDAHARRLRDLLMGCRFEPIAGLTDYEGAADLYRHCRRAGATVRRLVDCLIAYVAIRLDVPLLHADKDFDLVSTHTLLRAAEVD